jgi:hypothetical protein
MYYAFFLSVDTGFETYVRLLVMQRLDVIAFLSNKGPLSKKNTRLNSNKALI